jgi:pimeloyl-ACP methyl ester carboxylesterase
MRRLVTTLAAALALAVGSAGAAPPVSPAAAPFTSGRLTVEVRGQGPDVILVPGLTSSRAVWTRTADALDDTHRVHLVQVNGFAGQPAGANAQGPVFASLGDELARYIAARGLKRPAVIGHSMGGALALSLAASHPERIGRVMAVDALPYVALLMGPQATVEAIRPRAEAMRASMARMSPEQRAAMAPAMLTGLAKDTAARERGVKESNASDPGVVAQVMHDMMVTDLRPALAQTHVPITVLYAFDAGAGAPQSSVERLWTNAYAGVPGAKLIRIDDARHFIMDDQPARFSAEVAAFLAAPAN